MLRKIDPHRSGYTGPDQRVAPRSDCYCRIPATMPDLLQKMVTVVNISADGLLYHSDRHLDADERVVLKMPILGGVPGRVAWSLGGKTGVQFEEAIAPHDYLPLLKALGGRPADQ